VPSASTLTPPEQFIRLNGAVVGGLVGVVLALARWLVG
jgi:uncharacterized membrane-anchored protein YjiN (DUF445 family)